MQERQKLASLKARPVTEAGPISLTVIAVPGCAGSPHDLFETAC